MSYIIAQKNALVLTAKDDTEAIKLAENLVSTTGQECAIFEKRYEVVMSAAGAYAVDIATMASPSNIIRKVKEINGVYDPDLKKNVQNRERLYRETRQWIAFIWVRVGGSSTIKAGTIIGKNHSTVSNAIKKIANNFHFDKNFRRKYSDVIDLCLVSNPNCFEINT